MPISIVFSFAKIFERTSTLTQIKLFLSLNSSVVLNTFHGMYIHSRLNQKKIHFFETHLFAQILLSLQSQNALLDSQSIVVAHIGNYNRYQFLNLPIISIDPSF